MFPPNDRVSQESLDVSYYHRWEESKLTRSELIDVLASRQKHLVPSDAALGVMCLLRMLGDALAAGNRIEVRGFGVFSTRYRPPRMSRNPKTGNPVALPGRHAVHFKPGNLLRNVLSMG